MAIQLMAGMWRLPNVTIAFYYRNYCLYCYEDHRKLIWQANTTPLLILCCRSFLLKLLLEGWKGGFSLQALLLAFLGSPRNKVQNIYSLNDSVIPAFRFVYPGRVFKDQLFIIAEDFFVLASGMSCDSSLLVVPPLFLLVAYSEVCIEVSVGVRAIFYVIDSRAFV